MEKMKIEIWSDIACPFCYIGKRKLEAALNQFPHADEVELEWHSYELNPSLPKKPLNKSYYSYFAETHGVTVDKAKDMLARQVKLAADQGLDYHFEKLIVTNTSDALRLVKLAKKYQLADQAEEVLFKAYFIDGKCISDRTVLVDLGTSIGLKADEINTVLDSDQYVDEIEKDIRYSEDELHLEYIPFYRFNNKDMIEGSLEVEKYLEVLTNAYNDWKANGISKGNDATRLNGQACSIDGVCSID